jgi:hypothetical protein
VGQSSALSEHGETDKTTRPEHPLNTSSVSAVNAWQTIWLRQALRSGSETNGQARAKCALVVIVPCSALSRLGLPYQARPLPSHYSPLVSSAFSESKLTTDADIIRTPNAYDDVDQKLRSRIV